MELWQGEDRGSWQRTGENPLDLKWDNPFLQSLGQGCINKVTPQPKQEDCMIPTPPLPAPLSAEHSKARWPTHTQEEFLLFGRSRAGRASQTVLLKVNTWNLSKAQVSHETLSYQRNKGSNLIFCFLLVWRIKGFFWEHVSTGAYAHAHTCGAHSSTSTVILSQELSVLCGLPGAHQLYLLVREHQGSDYLCPHNSGITSA